MGKTLLARHLTCHEKRLVVVDTFHEYHQGLIFYDLPELLDAWSKLKKFRLLYRPVKDLGLRWICYMALAVRNCVVVIEELGMHSGPHNLSAGLGELIRMGRHRNVRLVATTQRPADVHKLIISQADLVLGRTFETNDVRYLKGFYEEADRLADLKAPKLNHGKITLEFVRPLVSNRVERVEIPL